MRKLAEFISFSILLGGSMWFGYKGQPVEMGLAIVAGAIAFALLNLDKFSRIKGAGFEAELREKIEAVIEKETELSASGEESNPVQDMSKVDNNTRAVINALQHPEYTWRYIGGIMKDTKLSSSDVKSSINWLVSNGYVKQLLGSHGTIWNLTEDGRYLSAVINLKNV